MQTLEQVAQILNDATHVSHAEVKRVFTKEKNRRRLNAYYNTVIETTTRNGFPVYVWMDIYQSYGDTMKEGDYVSDFEISTLNFSPVAFLKLTPEENDELLDAAFDKYTRWR